MTREEWLALRRSGGIGGTDAAAILGLDPYRSPHDVYLDKVGELPDQPEQESALWGRLLEDVVAREWARRTGVRIRRRNGIIRSRAYPWMIANVDRFVLDPVRGRGVVDVKTTAAHNLKNWRGGPPDKVVAQVQHYLVVTGVGFGAVAALFGGQMLRGYDLEPDRDFADVLIQESRRFWVDHVLARVPPSTDRLEAQMRASLILTERRRARQRADRARVETLGVADTWDTGIDSGPPL